MKMGCSICDDRPGLNTDILGRGEFKNTKNLVDMRDLKSEGTTETVTFCYQLVTFCECLQSSNIIHLVNSRCASIRSIMLALESARDLWRGIKVSIKDQIARNID